ncbi:MAG: histidinol dehydrogenase [Bacteroidetes bacterium]|nr:MAG: histidinol dehydrogenase [Bacteroidota bacterium]
MQIIEYPSPNDYNKLLARPVFKQVDLLETVKHIFEKVKQEGDKALIYYSEKFDRFSPKRIELSKSELEKIAQKCPQKLKNAIGVAASNVRKFHEAQKLISKQIETMPGVVCWQKAVPISKVGLYIPGGTAPLFSTVLMLAIPAKIANCKEIVLCTPPSKNGLHPAIAFAALISGVNKVCQIGGAQAIAAMTYGTESIQKVNKIFGPGNQYVTAAKQFATIEGLAIDMPAGPSEVLVYMDETAKPAFVAADLLSQAEHGTDSQVILICKEKRLVEKVIYEIQIQLENLPRKKIAKNALENSKAIIVNSDNEAINLINNYAPEHLILSVKNYNEIEKQIINAGSIFLGNFTPESAGDYASGTNHTLPTNGYAKMFSGVSLDSFQKKITVQEISKQGLQNLGNVIEIMAEAENLIAHKNAVSIRLENVKM